ncbi:MAG: 50S ribosomal protein L25 [bacterium]|nr:50S ribosomal protein L25 [bacterium]
MARIKLSAKVRGERGTREARRIRRRGEIPGILYAQGRESLPIGMDGKEIQKIIRGRGGEHAIIDLEVAGGGSEKPLTETVIVKEVQRDRLKDTVLHVDFAAISMTETLTAEISVVDTGTAAGIAQGGILEQILREVEVECLPADLPEQLAVDVSALDIGDGIKVKDITLPPGVKILNDPELTVFTVSVPKVEKVEEAAPEEAAAAAEAAPAEGAEKEPAEAEEKKEKKEKKEEAKGREKS